MPSNSQRYIEPANAAERTYLESLIRDDYERCHPGETLHELKRRLSFSPGEQGLYRDWMALAALRAKRGREAGRRMEKTEALSNPVKRIAAVRGASSEDMQSLFRDLLQRWRKQARIAGVIAEEHGLPDRHCRAGYLSHIATGTRFPIFQDLGPGSNACTLEGEGALTATAAIEKDIVDGCDLVLLSKFGKLEAAGQGLYGAFASAMAAEIPILTGVSDAYAPAWDAFAAPLSESLPADMERIEAWWHSVRAQQAA
ncbi:MAG: DUF2478 domain-containing protein [Pseudorhodoplanes sp.]